MPKNTIDNSKTIIYKITCNDENVTDCYVGRTTDITRRKYRHKHDCNYNMNYKLYQTINANGGWDNWTMSPLEECNCDTMIQAKIKEREWYEKLKPNLNTNIPNRGPSEYYNDNKSKFIEYANNYNKEHKDIRYKQYSCECGGRYIHMNRAIHFKTKKHLGHSSNKQETQEIQNN